jgi:hypothetical protein
MFQKIFVYMKENILREEGRMNEGARQMHLSTISVVWQH